MSGSDGSRSSDGITRSKSNKNSNKNKKSDYQSIAPSIPGESGGGGGGGDRSSPVVRTAKTTGGGEEEDEKRQLVTVTRRESEEEGNVGGRRNSIDALFGVPMKAGCGGSPGGSGEAPHDAEEYEVDDGEMVSSGAIIDWIGFGRFQISFMVIVGLAFGAEAMMAFLTTFIQKQITEEMDISDTEFATITTWFFGGMLVGSLVWGAVSDHFGRKWPTVLSMVLANGGGYGIAGSTSYGMVEAFFFLCGTGVGGLFIAVALFMELLPTYRRAFYLSIVYSLWSFGVLFQVLAAYLLRDLSWRYLAIVTTAPMSLCTVAALLLPESPRFLIQKHSDLQGAARVLTRIAKVNGKELPYRTPDVLAAKLNLPTESPPASPAHAVASIFSPSMRRLTVSLYFIWAGVAVSYYGIGMMTTAIFLKQGSFTGVAIATLGELPSYPLISWMCHRFGRKRPMQVLPICAIVFLFCFYFVHHYGGDTSNGDNTAATPAPSSGSSSSGSASTATPAPAPPLPVAVTVFEMIFAFLTRLCALLQFNTAFTYSPEAFPTTVRTTATGTCSAMARVTTMLAPFIAYPLRQVSSVAPYIVFAVALLGVAIGGTGLPFDTKDKSMDH